MVFCCNNPKTQNITECIVLYVLYHAELSPHSWWGEMDSNHRHRPFQGIDFIAENTLKLGRTDLLHTVITGSVSVHDKLGAGSENRTRTLTLATW